MAQHFPGSQAPPGSVTFFTTAPSLSVTVRMGNDEPKLSGGYGGWEVVPRPRRLGLTVWRGRNPFGLDIPILFDDFSGDGSVEQDISKLERMALPPKALEEPPVVRIRGPVPRSNLLWVIADITWGASTSTVTASGRVRQEATVHLLRYFAEDTVQLQTAAQKSRDANKPKKKSGGKKMLAVTAGDSLSSIAARELGDASRWGEIADLNGIRDPRSITIGTILRMP